MVITLMVSLQIQSLLLALSASSVAAAGVMVLSIVGQRIAATVRLTFVAIASVSVS